MRGVMTPGSGACVPLAFAVCLAACPSPPGGGDDVGAPRDARAPVESGDLDAGSTSGIDAARAAELDAMSDAPATDTGPAGCRAGTFPVAPAPADVMLVLDRSGSMRLGFDGTEDLPPDLWRWTSLRSAIAESLPTLRDRVRVGAKFYPDPIPPDVMEVTAEIACRCSDGVEVVPSLGSTPAILSAFDAFGPAGGTPTVEAVIDAREALSRSTEGRRFIVVATDGGPNCNPRVGADPSTCLCTSAREACLRPDEGIYSCVDDPRTLEVLSETATTFGIPVFLIGMTDDSRPDLTDYLERMAVAGGRPRSVPGERAFYSGRSDAELREAFDQITGSISRCAFISPSVPTDESRFSVSVDGATVPRDDGASGWTWTDRDRGEIELHGPACEQANEPGATVVAIVDDCPDT